jgi:hypothetical protein
LRASLCARRLRAISRRALPFGAAHLGAELLIGQVGEAQGVAVRDQNPLAEADQHRRIGERRHAAFSEHVDADEEVPIAGHEAEEASLAGLGQHRHALRLEAIVAGVVADPDLEQVAEHDDRIGIGAAKVRRERVEGARRVFTEVEIAQEVDAAP